MLKYQIISGRSEFSVEGRSTLHPLIASTNGVAGYLEFQTDRNNRPDLSVSPRGHLEIDISTLKSGNELYDLEAERRVDTRRYPKMTVELVQVRELEPLRKYHLVGDVSYRGITRRIEGDINLSLLDDHTIEANGVQVMDSRDFALPAPNLLGLKINSDFLAKISLVAERKR